MSLEPAHVRGLAARIGFGCRDVTPPVGIPVANWAAAGHAESTGVHRPLTVTALVLESAGRRLVLVGLDLGWWRAAEDEQALRGHLQERFGLGSDEVVVALTHTHSAPSVVPAYLELLLERTASAVDEAFAASQPGLLEWRAGRCGLARSRDLRLDGRTVCGLSPDGTADDVVLVGRAATASGRPLGTVVNYACHPTTLGPTFTGVSPDYAGELRGIVEECTGAPCLFLQGASGELAPAEQYVADPAVADRHGRELAHAVLSTLAGMPPPGSALVYRGVLESGAPLALWETERRAVDTTLAAAQSGVELPLRDGPGQVLAGLDQAVAAERLARRAEVAAVVGTARSTELPVWVWRLGEALLVATPAEAYSNLQRELRRRLAPWPVAVATVANGADCGYLVPRDGHADPTRYQVACSPYDGGSLERLVDHAEAAARRLTTP